MNTCPKSLIRTVFFTALFILVLPFSALAEGKGPGETEEPGGAQEKQGLEQNGLHRIHGTRTRQAGPLQPAIKGQGNSRRLSRIHRHGLPRKRQTHGRRRHQRETGQEKVRAHLPL